MRFKAALLHIAVILAALFVTGPVLARTVQLVGFGDSLMAGYQLPQSAGFTDRLQAALQAKGMDVTVANAGVSGDTTSGGLSRIDWSVPEGTDGVILELGANDALRGIAPEQTEKNLEQIISRLQERKVSVLLVAMVAPPNMGGDYAERFNAIFPRLAQKYSIPLSPFFLDGVALDATLKLEDGMHPNEKGVDVMVRTMEPSVSEFVRKILDIRK